MKKILILGITNRYSLLSGLVVVDEDGVIYRVPCEKMGELREDALKKLKEGFYEEILKSL